MVLWLSGLHIPETYLAALVQVACRKSNWPLDRSTLYTTVTRYTDPLDVETRPDTVDLFIEILIIKYMVQLQICVTPHARLTS